MELATALIAALLALVFQNLFSLKSQNVEIINNFIELYMEIERFAVDYWLLDAKNETDRLREQGYLVRINGFMAASAEFYSLSEKILGKFHCDFVDADQELFDLVTGADFMAKRRKMDAERATSIVESCQKMRLVLYTARKAQFWAL